MSEPPEDDDYERIDEELDDVDELLEIIEDDALVDAMREGVDLPPDLDALVDEIRSLHDRGMQEEITTPPWTDRATDPFPPPGGPEVSIYEKAQQLAAIAGRTNAAAGIQQMLGSIEQDQADAINAAGENSDDAQRINGAFEQAKQQLSEAMQMVAAAYRTIQDIATKHQQ